MTPHLFALLLIGLAACTDADTDTSEERDTDTTGGTEVDLGTDTGADSDADTDSERAGGPVDLTNLFLSLRSANCADYVDSYEAFPMDVQRSMAFEAQLTITASGGECEFVSNSLPNHDFNEPPANFATAVAAVSKTFAVTATPSAAWMPTGLTLRYDNAVFLNGVKLDLLAAACYGVGPGQPANLGNERIGCGDISTPWRYDPMFSGNGFGTDDHNAHTQPDGAYHYHGSPNALFEQSNPTAASPVVAFAADGFPIYGPYIDDLGTIRKVESGYTLLQGPNGGPAARVSQFGEGAFPGGTSDGTYRDDWEWTDAGDLDLCNGMTVDGVYGYYITNSYPWVLGCFQGVPNESFDKRSGGPPPM
jgi:hypothetical protein